MLISLCVFPCFMCPVAYWVAFPLNEPVTLKWAATVQIAYLIKSYSYLWQYIIVIYILYYIYYVKIINSLLGTTINAFGNVLVLVLQLKGRFDFFFFLSDCWTKKSNIPYTCFKLLKFLLNSQVLLVCTVCPKDMSFCLNNALKNLSKKFSDAFLLLLHWPVILLCLFSSIWDLMSTEIFYNIFCIMLLE